jgi:hypothetical protein
VAKTHWNRFAAERVWIFEGNEARFAIPVASLDLVSRHRSRIRSRILLVEVTATYTNICGFDFYLMVLALGLWNVLVEPQVANAVISESTHLEEVQM